MQLSKRQFLSFSSVGAAAFVLGCGRDASAKSRFAVTYSNAEWKKRLSPAAYRILRQEDTERPYSSALNSEKRRGIMYVQAAIKGYFRRLPNLKAARDGQVFTRHWQVGSARKLTIKSVCHEQKCIARNVAGILAMCLTTGRSPLENVIA